MGVVINNQDSQSPKSATPPSSVPLAKQVLSSLPAGAPARSTTTGISTTPQPNRPQPMQQQQRVASAPRPTQTTSIRWANAQTIEFIRLNRQDLYSLYQNIAANKYDSPTREQAIKLISDELDTLVARGINIPNYSPPVMAPSRDPSNSQNPMANNYGHTPQMQSHPQQSMYGYGDAMGYAPALEYMYQHQGDMAGMTDGMQYPNISQDNMQDLNAMDDLINYDGAGH